MLINLKIKRPGGSKVDIDGKQYHFAPNTNGDHVCDVTDKDHIKRFMSIDAYEPYETEAANAIKAGIIPEPPAMVVAESAPGPTVGQQVGDAPAGDGIEIPPPSAPTAADTYDMMDRAALATAIKAATGKEPHHKTSAENLRKALRELDAAQAA